MDDRPDWAEIEITIEGALLPVTVERWLAVQRFQRSLANLSEECRVLRVAALGATASLRALAEAMGPEDLESDA